MRVRHAAREDQPFGNAPQVAAVLRLDLDRALQIGDRLVVQQRAAVRDLGGRPVGLRRGFLAWPLHDGELEAAPLVEQKVLVLLRRAAARVAEYRRAASLPLGRDLVQTDGVALDRVGRVDRLQCRS